MTSNTTFETVTVSQDVIDRVDGELGVFDDFRRAELGHLACHNTPLGALVLDMFEITIQKNGEEKARQSIAGSLFASRVLRYAADDSGVKLPGLNNNDIVDKLHVITTKIEAGEDDENIDYTEFEARLAGQQPIVDRLQKFRHSFSRMSATTIFLLHEDVLKV